MIWATIIRVITGNVVPTLERLYVKRMEADNDKDKRRFDERIKVLEAKRDLISQGMQTRIFWFVWGLFAVPLGCWWALVMIDTMVPFIHLGIPDLPETIRPWANTIFNSIFISGVGLSAVTVVASRFGGRR